MGKKSPDYWGAYGCADCHKVMDRQDRRYIDFDIDRIWLEAIAETQQIMAKAGLLLFTEKSTRPQKVGKVVDRRSPYKRIETV